MRTLFAGFLSMIASVALAEDRPHMFTPDQIKIGEVALHDRATGGCWTNLKESREYLEEQFRLNGYELLSKEALIAPEEERKRVGNIVRSLANEDAPSSVVKGAYLTMLQHNSYDAMIKVLASRTPAGFCVGSLRVSINRVLVGHHEDVVHKVDVMYLDQVFSENSNVNIIVLDLSKTLVKYLKTGKLD